jgi:hypothetical protein
MIMMKKIIVIAAIAALVASLIWQISLGVCPVP